MQKISQFFAYKECIYIRDEILNIALKNTCICNYFIFVPKNGTIIWQEI
jgi:hypothetical protein